MRLRDEESAYSAVAASGTADDESVAVIVKDDESDCVKESP